MRTSFVVACSCLGAAAVVAAQTSDRPKDEPRAKNRKSITLTGCVQPDEKVPDQLTIADRESGKIYRLSGLSLRNYLGKPVQLDGGIIIKGLQIKGGLGANPNIAAQAGAMDPAQAAVAAATAASSPGNVDDVQEFRVKTARPGPGSCQ